MDKVTDSTDWITTQVPALAALDSALRCQVCKDFYDTPMITTCSHTFCSLCIRRCFASEGKCPTCRANDQESKLRRNWTVQEAVDAFQASRARLLELTAKMTTEDEAGQSARKRRKRKVADTDLEERPEGTRRGLRSHTTRFRDSPIEPIEVLDSEDDGDYEDYEEDDKPAEADGLVSCPICNKRMKEETVFTHLDKCSGDSELGTNKKRGTRPQRNGNLLPSVNPLIRNVPAKPSPPLVRIPQLNYSLLKDGALRKKLQELGIYSSSSGTRQALISRHKEWVNLWNSNCDSSRPRSKRELIQELDAWERTQGAGNTQTVTPTVMKKDFDGNAWARNNKTQFDDLISVARARRGQAKEQEGQTLAVPIKYRNSNDTMNAEQFADATPPATTADSNPDSSKEATHTDPRYAYTEESLSKVRDQVKRLNEESHDREEQLRAMSALPASTAAKSNPSPIPTFINPASIPTQRSSSMSIVGSPPSSMQLSSALSSSPPRGIPMFKMPERPVADIDDGMSLER